MTTPEDADVRTTDVAAPSAWRRPSPRMLWAQRAVGSVVVGVLGALTATAAGLVSGAGAAVLVLGGAALVLGVVWYAAGRRFAAWGYLERQDELLVRRGVVYRRLSAVPYGRMQFVDVTAGPVDRWLGLATVHLHTAAAASDAYVPGLPAEEAARLRDRLAALGEARAAGL